MKAPWRDATPANPPAFAVGDRVRFLRRYWLNEREPTSHEGTVTSVEPSGDVLVRPDGFQRSKRFWCENLADLEKLHG